MLINTVLYSPQSLTEVKHIDTFDWDKELKTVLDYIKTHEGFSPFLIDDLGYWAICYGNRIIYIEGSKDFTYPISKEKCDCILKDVFFENIRYINYHYPELTRNKLLSLAHLSYAVGIGQVLKKKVYSNGILHKWRLYNLRRVDRTLPQFRALRVWEYELFYREYPIKTIRELNLN